MSERATGLKSYWVVLWLAWAALLLSYEVNAQQEHPPPAASWEVLADLLEDEATRHRLIEQLHVLASGPAPLVMPPASRSESAEDPPHKSVAGRLVDGLQRFTSTLSADLAATATAIRTLGRGGSLAVDIEQRWGAALRVFTITLVVLFAAYGALRLLARVGFARLNVWVHRRPGAETATTTGRPGGVQSRRTHYRLSRKLLAVLGALAIDLAAALLAALAGYLAAAALAPQPDDTLFAFQLLVAFVLIEAVKAVSRGVFATRYDQLRLLPLEPSTARYWNRWLTLLIGVTGYCLLVAVPVTQAVLLPSIARLLGLVVMLGVYIYATGVIWRQRKVVRQGLADWAQTTSTAVFGTLIRVLARTWHLLAIAYFTVLLVISQADQQRALQFMMDATLQSAVAMGAGALLAAVLSSLLMRPIVLPENWRANFPLLEARINSYVPAALKGLRLLILIVVALVVLDAWRAFDLPIWLSSPSGQATLAMLFHVALVLVIAALGWTVVASLIEHRLGGAGRRASEREKTLLMLFRNATAVVIATMTILVVLSQIGVDIGPLIAGAGVVGLAVGFGAQKLVQDVITGVFIQLENGMNQNDIVEVTGLFGTVEKITIRSVMIRTLDGGYHLIPFSTIDRVSNHTREYGYHYGEYYVAYRESVDAAMAQLEAAFSDLMQDATVAPEVLEHIEIPGVTALDERGFRIRVMIKTTPGNQWMVQRAYNRLVKQRFEEAGIELPYPQAVVHFGRDRNGYAAPVDIRAVESLQRARGITPAPGHSTPAGLETG